VLTWAAALAAILLAAAATSLVWRELRPTRVAVVVPREIDARAANQGDSVVRFKLHAGSEVMLREQQGDWLRIALPSGEQAWIQSSQAEVVEL
jgi:SH3-like domain-containing protein